MKRILLLAIVASFGLAASACVAAAQSATDTPDDGVPGQVQLTGVSVADMAQFVAGVASDSGGVPDWAQARTTAGRLQRLSATDAFVALARALAAWDASGQFPESVTIAVGGVTPPVLATGDLPDPKREPLPQQEVVSDLFVSQVTEALRRIDQFHLLPTALGVGGKRLSAAQTLDCLAVVVDYAFRNGKLDEALYVPDVTPPPMWVAHTSIIAERVPRPASAEEDGDDSAAGEASGPLPPVRANVETIPQKPTLTVYPVSGKIQGVIDIAAGYTGPTAKFILFQLDGQTKAITNTPPYGYRLDTRQLAPGEHKLLVRVLGPDEKEIIRAYATYVVLAPGAVAKPAAPAAKPATTVGPPPPPKAEKAKGKSQKAKGG